MLKLVCSTVSVQIEISSSRPTVYLLFNCCTIKKLKYEYNVIVRQNKIVGIIVGMMKMFGQNRAPLGATVTLCATAQCGTKPLDFTLPSKQSPVATFD